MEKQSTFQFDQQEAEILTAAIDAAIGCFEKFTGKPVSLIQSENLRREIHNGTYATLAELFKQGVIKNRRATAKDKADLEDKDTDAEDDYETMEPEEFLKKHIDD